MKKLQIGVIGCGTIASIHLDAILKEKHAKLIAVCDVKLDRAKWMADEYQCDYTLDYHELLSRDDIDVIHVLTPHHTHYTIAQAVIQATKHCLIEKPMTIKTDDAKALIQLTKEHPEIKCGVVFQNRLNTTAQKIRQLIDERTFGSLLSIRGSVTWCRGKDYYQQDAWRGHWETEGGGVLINQAIHTLDLIQWYGGEIESIRGSYGTYHLHDVIEVEDTATLMIHFKSGMKGLLFATNTNKINTPIELEVVFDQAILKLQDDTLYIKTSDAWEELVYDQQSSGKKAYWGLSHEKLIHNFYQSILDNCENYVNPQDAAQTIEILEKFYAYANQNKEIKIENTKEW